MKREPAFLNSEQSLGNKVMHIEKEKDQTKSLYTRFCKF